jgi:hypothetical protein
MVTYVQTTLASCLLITCIFHLWMLKGAHDIFAIVELISCLTTRRPNINYNLPLDCLKLLTSMVQLDGS